MQAIKQANKLTKSSDIRKAFNWLFHDITPNGPEAAYAMLEIMFLKERTGAVGKDTPNGEKAIALFTSNMIFAQAKFDQPIPPPLGLKDLTVQVYFFMNEWLYIEANNIDFTAKFEDQFIVTQRTADGWEKMFFVSVQTLFKLAIAGAQSESIETLEPPATENCGLVKVGKSSYNVWDYGAGKFKIKRADNHAELKPDSNHGLRIIKAYNEQKAQGIS